MPTRRLLPTRQLRRVPRGAPDPPLSGRLVDVLAADQTALVRPPIVVVGIGADGWGGLHPASVEALESAAVVLGSQRQLDLVRGHVRVCRPWPSPMLPAVTGLLDSYPDGLVAVLASGDPMLYGIGVTLVGRFGTKRVRVLPHVSSASLACARLGWASADTAVVSAVDRPLNQLVRELAPGRRVLVLVSEADAVARVAALLTAQGYGPSELTVLAELGGPKESMASEVASRWGQRPNPRLAIVAVCSQLEAGAAARSIAPGLPDEEFRTDGVMTKREIRALTLAALGPVPGELLWDIGAGSGTIAVEWSRLHVSCSAVAVEPRADRRALIAANADALGAPRVQVVAGSAPDVLAGLEPPDAVFVGGGLTSPGVLEGCLESLRNGARLVANSVTLESEAVLTSWHARLGGRLSRIAVSHAEPVGSLHAFRSALPVTQWSFTKGASP
jgi:precorrin-6Y C5,15-methyltransferase (decarboxylating)